MNFVTFNNTTYVAEHGVGVPEAAVVLADLKGPVLLDLHNLVASNTGDKSVKKFSDKKTAVKRTMAILEKWDEAEDGAWEEAAPKAKPKAKAKKAAGTRSFTRMRFVYPFSGHDNLRTIKDSDSLRGRVAKALKSKSGASFEEVVEIVKQFDKDRGGRTGEEQRRAYEVIRLLYYYVGYGLKQTKTGKIKIHTDE